MKKNREKRKESILKPLNSVLKVSLVYLTIFFSLLGSISIISLAANKNQVCKLNPYYIIHPANISYVLNVSEGELIKLNPSFLDLDNDNVTFFFSWPLTQHGYWDIPYNASGQYVVTIIANDTHNITYYHILLNVKDKNRLPILIVKNITINETQVAKLNFTAYDPDGDNLTYIIPPPFNESFEWKTELGDYGKYEFELSVFDGKNLTTKKFYVNVKKLPRPPKIIANNIQYGKEGKNFTLKYEIISERNYTVKLIGCINKTQWWFNYDSPRTCNVTIVVNDSIFVANKTITIKIKDTNRKPIIKEIRAIVNEKKTPIINNTLHIYENSTVQLLVKAFDPDRDQIKILSPTKLYFDFDSEGSHNYKITVSDGKVQTSKSLKIIVKNLNRKPKIIANETQFAIEGQNFTLKYSVIDEDNQPLTVRISGWMNSSIKYVDYDQQGWHKVKITANDTIDVVKKEISVYVKNVNRIPILKSIKIEIFK